MSGLRTSSLKLVDDREFSLLDSCEGIENIVEKPEKNRSKSERIFSIGANKPSNEKSSSSLSLFSIYVFSTNLYEKQNVNSLPISLSHINCLQRKNRMLN